MNLIKNIPGGLKNSILFEELKSIFNKLGDNTESFVAGSSTQGNESLNSIIARKAPKSVFYSSSESYDFRVASAVAQKNLGEKYVKKRTFEIKCKSWITFIETRREN